MPISDLYTSPNFAKYIIPVEFCILHYTAADLQRTLGFFTDPAKQLCAHFVLDTDGTVYDLGGFYKGPIRQGAHAGVSRLQVDGKDLSAFNQMSIGIEIVNLNGNLFAYSESQYESLRQLLSHLIGRFPDLKKPFHILGHEHIAGFRGKCDPGVKFDWKRVLEAQGLTMDPFYERFACSADDIQFVNDRRRQAIHPDALFWSRLSSELEGRIKNRQSQTPS